MLSVRNDDETDIFLPLREDNEMPFSRIVDCPVSLSAAISGMQLFVMSK